MKAWLALFLAAGAAGAEAADLVPPEAAEPAPEAKPLRLRPKRRARGETAEAAGLLQPDVHTIDTPTSAVLDYGGYASRTRFFSSGGVLQYLSFGVFQSLNLGASLTVDGLIGNDTTVRLRAPGVQVKYRFYDGDRRLPSLALGYDSQGHIYNQFDKRYNQRQRGFYVVATQELGLPGLQAHPSVNISDFDSNSFFGAIPVSLNIRDKVSVLWEWDNINDFRDSRVNSGLRVYITPKLHLDFAVRGIGQGGRFTNGSSRGPERIAQLRYSGNF